MKKITALILCVISVLPFTLFSSSAAEKEETKTLQCESVYAKTENSIESVFADGENSLIIFVPGLGQSNSYLFDRKYVEEGAFESGTLQDYENYAPLIEDHAYSDSWSFLANRFSTSIKKSTSKTAILKIAGAMLRSVFTHKNEVNDEDVETLISNIFSFNILDDNGNLNSRVVTPCYSCPLSEYPGRVSKNRFYSVFPCADIARSTLGKNYEDYIYVYNFSPFSYTSRNVSGLHDFIRNALQNNKVGAKDVVLVPVSMGASVVSAYLAEYLDVQDSHVRRVVPVVGCWNGTDVVPIC